MYELEFKPGVRELCAMLQVSEEDAALAVYEGMRRRALGGGVYELCSFAGGNASARRFLLECEWPIEGRPGLVRVVGVKLA